MQRLQAYMDQRITNENDRVSMDRIKIVRKLGFDEYVRGSVELSVAFSLLYPLVNLIDPNPNLGPGAPPPSLAPSPPPLHLLTPRHPLAPSPPSHPPRPLTSLLILLIPLVPQIHASDLPRGCGAGPIPCGWWPFIVRDLQCGYTCGHALPTHLDTTAHIRHVSHHGPGMYVIQPARQPVRQSVSQGVGQSTNVHT